MNDVDAASIQYGETADAERPTTESGRTKDGHDSAEDRRSARESHFPECVLMPWTKTQLEITLDAHGFDISVFSFSRDGHRHAASHHTAGQNRTPQFASLLENSPLATC